MTRSRPLLMLVVAAIAQYAVPSLATSPDKTCFAIWWVPSPWIPTELTDLPSDGAIALPIAASDYNGFRPGVSPSELVVEVRDDADRLVEGVVGDGYTEPFLEFIGGAVAVPLPPWWRPAHPMLPGTYSLRLAVNEPPKTDKYKGCTYQSFERTMTFTVSSLPAPQPDIELELTDTATLRHTVVYEMAATEYGGPPPPRWPCPNEPTVVCGHFGFETHTFSVERAVTGIPGGPLYALIETERDDFNGGRLTSTYHAEYPPEPWPLVSPWSRNVGYPIVTDTLCATARLWSLHELKVVVEKTECIPVASVPPLSSLPPPVCDPVECTRVRRAYDVVTGADDADQGCSTTTPVHSMMALFLVAGLARRWRRPRS